MSSSRNVDLKLDIKLKKKKKKLIPVIYFFLLVALILFRSTLPFRILSAMSFLFTTKKITSRNVLFVFLVSIVTARSSVMLAMSHNLRFSKKLYLGVICRMLFFCKDLTCALKIIKNNYDSVFLLHNSLWEHTFTPGLRGCLFFYLSTNRQLITTIIFVPPEMRSASEEAVFDCRVSRCDLKVHEHKEPLK